MAAGNCWQQINLVRFLYGDVASRCLESFRRKLNSLRESADTMSREMRGAHHLAAKNVLRDAVS